MNIRRYFPADEAAVIALWRTCDLVRPWNDPRKDIARKLAVQSELFLVGERAGEIIATVMVGYEGHRGAINYLAVSPAHQRQGFGEAMMARAEALLRERGCPKINLNVRKTNLGVVEFYQKLGYATDEVVCMGKRLEDDTLPS